MQTRLVVVSAIIVVAIAAGVSDGPGLWQYDLSVGRELKAKGVKGRHEHTPGFYDEK